MLFYHRWCCFCCCSGKLHPTEKTKTKSILNPSVLDRLVGVMPPLLLVLRVIQTRWSALFLSSFYDVFARVQRERETESVYLLFKWRFLFFPLSTHFYILGFHINPKQLCRHLFQRDMCRIIKERTARVSKKETISHRSLY